MHNTKKLQKYDNYLADEISPGSHKTYCGVEYGSVIGNE